MVLGLPDGRLKRRTKARLQRDRHSFFHLEPSRRWRRGSEFGGSGNRDGIAINWPVQEDTHVSVQLLSTEFQGSLKVRFGQCGSGWPKTVIILVPKSLGSDSQCLRNYAKATIRERIPSPEVEARRHPVHRYPHAVHIQQGCASPTPKHTVQTREQPHPGIHRRTSTDKYIQVHMPEHTYRKDTHLRTHRR